MNKFGVFMKNQKGLGLITFLIWGVIFGLGGIYGFKIAKPYFDHSHLKELVRVKLKEGIEQNLTDQEIKRRIWDSSNVNSMNLPADTITIDKTDDNRLVGEIKWQPTVPLWKGATLVLDLNIKEVSTITIK